MALQLGDIAPDFDAETTEGKINFHDWLGGTWAVFFSHPKDFTPVCTTELGEMARLAPKFKQRGVKVIALSVDSLEDHHAWAEDIREIQGYAPNYPMIADEDRKVSNLYGMLHHKASDTLTVRSVFVIDSEKVIRLMLTYPASTGRDFDELLRAIDSLQLTSSHKVATPVNWCRGDDVIILPSLSDEEAEKRFPDGWRTLKSYFRVVRDPE